MDLDGGNMKRLTDDLGYDGGAFFSPDGKQICYRANHPTAPEDVQTYKDLLSRNLVRPSRMELFVMNADGTGKRQVTRNGFANFCPYFTPDGKRLIFASNMDDPRGRPPNFELYLINLDGTGLERVTQDPTFDGFPMFSPDGKKVVWASNRNAKVRGETNVFVADWVE
jgi:TolB protein